mgnify:CR=1 FL=1
MVDGRGGGGGGEMIAGEEGDVGEGGGGRRGGGDGEGREMFVRKAMWVYRELVYARVCRRGGSHGDVRGTFV